MKFRQTLAATCLAACSAFAQTTQNYADATGEIAPAVGDHPHLDITSVDVTVNAAGSRITFKINLAGNPITTDWGNYMIGIRSNPGGAVTGNGWSRPINMAGGMTHWIGSYVNFGNGGEIRTFGNGWPITGGPDVSKDSTSVSITASTALLGLGSGEEFSFDVYSSGGNGNDSAVDALSAAGTSVAGWAGPYTTDIVGGSPNPAKTFTMPLAGSREVEFRVDMTVATRQAYFTPGASVIRVIGQFNGWDVGSGVVLSDPNSDGIYTGPLQVTGFEDSPFGGYKFFIDGGPNFGYEAGADRNFDLGPVAALQTLPVVYFSNITPFDAWVAGFDGLSNTSRGGDPDGDGLTNEEEYLFGTSPASGAERAVTVVSGSGGLTLTWLQLATGGTYVLEQNDDLAGAWTPGPVVPSASGNQAGVPAGYVRMEALVPIAGARNFVRINGTE